MKILSGNSNIGLLHHLFFYKNFSTNDLVKIKIDKFKDQELRIQILDSLLNEDIVILQSLSYPVGENLLELLLIIDAVVAAGGRKITVLIPYLGYSRQDSSHYNYGPNSAQLIARILQASPIDKIVTIDLHSEKIEDFFSIPLININPIELFLPLINIFNDPIIVAPDKGCYKKLLKTEELSSFSIIGCSKHRPQYNICNITEVMGTVQDRNCIIIDDIIDTAGTICSVSEILKQKGAKSIISCVTHAVLSEGSIENINNSCVDQIYVTNSINLEKKMLSKKFHVLSIVELINKYI